jgi:3-oxoacyl-[acyl-carrier protein] reductase
MPAVSSQDLSHRSALVTGVSRRSGIGFAIASHLLTLGLRVFVQSWRPHDEEQPWGQDLEPMSELIDDLASIGPEVGHAAIDLADAGGPLRLVEEARAVLDHIDVLILNHARSSHQSLEELTSAELHRAFAVNSIASLMLVKEWAAEHDDARPGGRVLFITTGIHLAPMISELPYAASKAAVQQLTETLAVHLASRQITVNTINPGPTDTGWASPKVYESVLRRMPFGSWGQPADAAHLIGWLISDEGRWITGQTINAEGGFNRWA